MKMYAYSHTQAGIERRAQQRGLASATAEPSQQRRALAVSPVASNVVRLVIPMTPAQKIIHEVAAKYGLKPADIIGKCRARHIIPARDEAIAAVKELKAGKDKWSYSLPVIGRIFGDRDHTSILASLRRSAKRGLA